MAALRSRSLVKKESKTSPFVVHSPPKIVRLTVDFHENFVQVPVPL